MYTRERQRRAWVVIPAIVLMVAITVIAGPTANAAYTAQVPFGAARPFAVLAAAALTGNGTTVINGDVGWGTAFPFTGTVNGAQIPVAVVTIPRLPSTSTSNEFEPLKPVNFIQGFALGFALVLIGGFLLLGRAGPPRS